MKTLIRSILLIVLVSFQIGCGSENNTESEKKKAVSQSTKSQIPQEETPEEPAPENNLTIEIGSSKELLKLYYEIPHIKEFYQWINMSYDTTQEFSYPDDLTQLDYDELRLLRNEIFARNGYLFNDGFLRGYFNRTNWYMPIFEVDSFKIVMSRDEQDLVNKIIIEENKRKEFRFVDVNGLELYNADLVVNYKQFAQVSTELRKDLATQNFSILSTRRSLPFYAYDENAYQYIPHYITTDLYLFILHKYFSQALQKLEEEYLASQLTDILSEVHSSLNQLDVPNQQETIDWAKLYLSILLTVAGDSTVSPPESLMATYNQELELVGNENGNPVFIKNQYVNYKNLTPRGHYTKNDLLKTYFKTFKWLSLNGADITNDLELGGMVLIASVIKNSPELSEKYKSYKKVIEKLAGKEDNLSLTDIIESTSSSSIEESMSKQNISKVRIYLNGIKKERILPVYGEQIQESDKMNKRAFFNSSTYSLSGEIFSKLVHVNMEDSKRPFPRGLDVPAVFENETAENIIINDFKDAEQWDEYTTRLKDLQTQFKSFDEWEDNYGFKGVQTALSASAEKEIYPDYMKSEAYNRKELSTTLASWAHVKHDLILYQEKPWAAEAGQGGGPAPPKHFSYVEPNLEFWNRSLELVDWLQELTDFNKAYVDELIQIKSLGKLLKKVAYKQLEGKEITEAEHSQMHWVGGAIEIILLGLLESDHIPEREKKMGIIADVYAYDGGNLNVAVGDADDIFVIVPIEGEYHLARGSVFSYYEFVGDIYTDEKWREELKSFNKPERPEWLKPIIKNHSVPQGQMQFRY